MARSYAGLANMPTRFGFRLAKAREGSQHLGMPVRYLLEAKNGVLPFRSLGDVERKLSAMAQIRDRPLPGGHQGVHRAVTRSSALATTARAPAPVSNAAPQARLRA